MKTGDKVKVWNHTLAGKLIEEGIGTLRRKDLSFKGETIEMIGDQPLGTGEIRTGKFERWFVTFDDAPKEPVSRWVRIEDKEDYFASANKHLAKLTKEFNKIL
jgi:hypothetical protein